MELSLLPSLLPIVGFGVGVVVGLTGLGGGSIMTPALIFGLGISPAVAVGTDLIFAGVTKSVGVYAHRLAGNIDWRTVRLLACGSLPASLVSVVIIDRLVPSREALDVVILPVLGVALILTAAVLVVRSRVEQLARRLWGGSEPSGGWLVLSGAVLGALVALSSVGAGAIGIAALMLCRPGLSTRRLIGTDIAHALPLALVAGAGHLQVLGTVDVQLLLALLVGSIPGTYVGSSLSGRVPEPVLRSFLVAVLVAAGLLCIIP